MSRNILVENITARAKLQAVNNANGNPSANNQQGTTFQIYDSLPLDGSKEYKFFENTQNKIYPLTNVSKGMLTAGESMTLLNAQIQFVEMVDPFAATPDFTVVSIAPLSSSLQWQQGEIDFMNTNTRTLKKMLLQTWAAEFNSNAAVPDQNVYNFMSILTIESFLEFTANIRIPVGVTVENTVAKLIFEGFGGIYQPKNPS